MSQGACGRQHSDGSERANSSAALSAPLLNLIDECVHCGFCLNACPTYALWGEEMDSPRGRIYLMKMEAEAQVEMNETLVGHFDKCLGCMACVPACPSGVQYDRLIEETRSAIERDYRRPRADRWFRRALLGSLPWPGRLRALAAALWLYQASGLCRLLRLSGVVRHLPARLAALDALLPRVALKGVRVNFPEYTPARGAPRRRVGLLLGCVQRVFFSDVHEATVRVLTAEGCEVFAPAAQACCGALPAHAGQEQDAQAFARRVIDAFERARVDVVVSNAAGCGSTLKSYGRLLRDDPAYAERAAAFAARCKDISEVLAELEPRATRHPLPLRVAYQDACHLRHAQGVKAQPRSLLNSIPGLEVLETHEPEMCCGSAGIYNIIEPEAARELGDRKVRNVLDTGADVLATSNPGCLLQIRSGLARAGRTLPAVHLIELLDASISGERPWARAAASALETTGV
jgi:glycolate oxidase iron-sulfur subunit